MKLISISVLASALLSSCASSSSDGEGAADSARTSEPLVWWQATALDAGVKLGGCAIGDIDPRYDGNEIAVVTGGGRVLCVRRTEDGWEEETIAVLPGEKIQCAIGDVAPASGQELVVVGVSDGKEDDDTKGLAVLFRFSDGEWREALTFEDRKLLHAVAIGSLSATREKDSLVVAGFARGVHALTIENGVMDHKVIGHIPGNAKGAAFENGAVVLACDDGSLVRIRADGAGEPEAETLAQLPAPLARVAAHDAEILFAANDGQLRLWRDGAVYELFESPDRLRGAVIADLDPTHPGVEYATAGYDGEVTVVTLTLAEVTEDEDGAVVTRTEYSVLNVGHDDDRLHHLAYGELPGLGPCLVACGYSGRLIVMGHGPKP